jgi:FkbM family methyltransferase
LLNIVFTNNPKKTGQLFINGRCQFVWLREHVGRKIALRIFERKETRFFHDYLKDGDICFDIGANVGYYTNLFASRVGKLGRVIAVDPIPRNVLLIELTSSINNTDGCVTVVCGAVSDTNSKLAISNDRDSSYASIGTQNDTQAVQIDGITIDSLFARYGFTRIDVLKMDIEGWEYRALKGMQGILSNRKVRPRLMMIELYSEHLQKYGNSIKQICEYLQQFDYQATVLDNNGRLIRFESKHYDKFYNVFFLDGKKEG